MPTINAGNLHTIYFAGGCFWGVEEYFSRIPGVYDAVSGYANGAVKNPTYRQVCTQNTGAAETVRVRYDPSIVSLKTLTEQLFKIIDPTSVNKQGNDIGDQYRTGVYYVDDADLPTLRAVFEAVRERYATELATELLPLASFYEAEEEHQDYLKKNPRGYCHISFDSLRDVQLEPQADASNDGAAGSSDANAPAVPKVDPTRYTRPSDEQIAQMLTPEQYEITQKDGTEHAYMGEYWDNTEPGLYVDVVTGEPLFASSSKFNSGCGWPSFSEPIDPDVIVERADSSFGMQRTEVRSRVGDSHLGHVFDDGPARLGGLRYCIDSAALRFIPYDEMDAEGYSEFKPLCATYGR